MSKKSKKEKNNKLNIIISIIYLIITAIFCGSILRMNILPGKYVLVFSLVELIITTLVCVGLTKKHKTIKINIICLIIVIVLSTIYICATNYANATVNFLGSMFSEEIETEEYYVVLQKNSQYNKITELKNKEMYLFQIEDDVKTEIENKVNVTLTKQDSLFEVGENLMEGHVDAIIVSSSQYDMLDEEIENFKENTKIIYTAIHKMKKADIENENSKYNVENNVFNIYISGIDTSGSINNVSRSDANIVVTVNTKTHEILLTSIPRDYYVTLHSKKAKDKLTHSGIYGINETVTTVEDLLNIDINYYVRVNFTTVIKLVDVLDGIDVNSEYSFSSVGYHFNKGINHLNGESALVFSRERHSFIDGDNQRVKNQQAVISAIVKKITSSKTLLTKYTSILSSLEGCFQTNIDYEDISQIVKSQLNDMPSWTISSNSLVGSGSYGPTYSMGSQELYIMIPNADSVKSATNKINAVLEK